MVGAAQPARGHQHDEEQRRHGEADDDGGEHQGLRQWVGVVLQILRHAVHQHGHLANGQANFTFESFVNFENIYSGSGNDTLYGTTGANTMYGNAGNDWIFGDVGNDSIYGGAGNDYLSGGDGNDRLEANSGTDTLHGWNDSDTLVSSGYGQYYGDSGNDYIYAGGGGGETLDGGAGTGWVNTASFSGP